MKEECIICKAPLIYLEKDEMMECVLCHMQILLERYAYSEIGGTFILI